MYFEMYRWTGRLVGQARPYYWLLLAESHLTRRLFGSMVCRIAALPVPAGWGAAAKKQAGRRKDGDGEVYENSLEISHFQALTYPEGAGLAPFLGRWSRSGWKE